MFSLIVAGCSGSGLAFGVLLIIVLPATASLTLIYFPSVYLPRVVMEYKSLQTRMVKVAQSGKLLKALPNPTAALLRFDQRLVLLFLYAILLPLEPVYWIRSFIGRAYGSLRAKKSQTKRVFRTRDTRPASQNSVEMV